MRIWEKVIDFRDFSDISVNLDEDSSASAPHATTSVHNRTHFGEFRVVPNYVRRAA